MLKSIFILSFFFSFQIQANIQGQEDLDVSLLRERIRKVHGEFSMKLNGEWTAALAGRNESWTWGSQGWLCGKKDPSCASWTPKSFLLWQKGLFFQTWIPKRRLSFEVQKTQSRQKPAEVAASADEATNHDEASPDVAWGQNAVGEVWVFEKAQESGKSEEIKVLISARDQRIERIESEEGVEYFEWSPSRKSKTLELSKIVLERAGTRVMISRK